MEQVHVLPDEIFAEIWINGARSSQEPDAEFNCGLLYASGYGVEQDYEEALGWFLKAAEKGHVEAICNVGAFYGGGIGVEQDMKKAAEWFQRAAELGDKKAERNLAKCLQFIKK